jgi:hypothetical protein
LKPCAFLCLLVTLVYVGMPVAGFGSDGYTEEYQFIEDAVQIQVLDDRAIAFRSSRAPVSIDLKLTEQVHDIRTRGLVGIVITSTRLLAVSKTSDDWIVQPLGLTENAADVYVSEKLVLAITEDRAIVFDGILDRFVSFDNPLGEQVIEQEAARNVAVFATAKRAAAYASGSGFFKEIPFKLGANFRSLEASAGLAVVQTSDRVLAFQARDGIWVTRSRPILGTPP